MIAPVFGIEVNDHNVMLHLENIPAALKTNLRDTIAKLTDELLAQVRALEPRRTGRLQNLTRGFIDERQDYIRGRVRVLGPSGRGHNIAAAALEYGAHRRFSVRAYQRRGIAVRAYERQANIAARRFLRGPGEAIRERARKELEAAVAAAFEAQSIT